MRGIVKLNYVQMRHRVLNHGENGDAKEPELQEDESEVFPAEIGQAEAGLNKRNLLK